MAEGSMTRIFIFITLFYSFVFTFMGMVDLSGVTIESGDNNLSEDSIIEGVLDFVLPNSWVDIIYDFYDNINNNISGMPSIVSSLLFTPLFILGVYFLILLIIKIIHG